MPRARLYRPVLDEMGNLVADIFVRLIDPASNTTITSPVYLGPTTTEVTPQPIHFQDGVISLYTDSPRRVRVGVKKGDQAEKFYEDIDILVTELGGLAAHQIAFTPTADIVGDDVQEAIVLVQGNLLAHVGDPLAAHHASAISVTPVNNIDSLNVQGALGEVGASIINLEALTADHTATDLTLDARLDSLESQGPVYTAPNGSTWRITVSNTGALGTVQVSAAPKPAVTNLTGIQDPNGTLTWSWTPPNTPLADDDPTSYRSEVFRTTGGVNTLTVTETAPYGTNTETVAVAVDNTWRVDVYAVYPTGDSVVTSVAIGLYVAPTV